MWAMHDIVLNTQEMKHNIDETALRKKKKKTIFEGGVTQFRQNG